MTRPLALVLALALAGCPAAGPAAPAPPDVRLGEDACDLCAMLITEERFAAAWTTPSGEVRRFDDPGDLVLHDARTDEPVAAYWVRDHESCAWLRAETATFVRAATIRTPMGTGLVAFGDPARARAFAAGHPAARLLAFPELAAERFHTGPGGSPGR